MNRFEGNPKHRPVLTPPEDSSRSPFGVLGGARTLLTRDSELEVCKSLCRLCCDTLGGDLSWTGLYPEDSHRLKPVYAFPSPLENLDLIRTPLYHSPSGVDPIMRSLRTGEMTILQDLAVDRSATRWREDITSRGYRSAAAFPIRKKDMIVGILVVLSRTPNWFSEERVGMFGALTDLTGIALERCDLLREASQSSEDLERRVRNRLAALENQYLRLAALAEVSLFSYDPESVLDDIAKTTARLLPASAGASIVLWDSTTDTFYDSVSSIVGQPRDVGAQRVRHQGGATRWILENREILTVSDIDKTPFPTNEMNREYGIRSYVGVPVIENGKPLGVLYALDHEKRIYSKEDLEFLTTMASRVGAALTSARLLESERNQRHLAEALREVTSDLNSTLELPVILNRLLEHLAKIISFDNGFVLLEHRGRFRIEAILGSHRCDRAAENGGECCGKLFESVQRDGKPRLINEEKDLTDLDCCEMIKGAASALSLPLMSADRVVGALALTSTEKGFFGEKEAEIAHAFAQQAAIAVRNADLFLEVKRMATLDPLTRIYNRGHFFELASLAHRSAIRHHRPLTLFMIDIDKFKDINDTRGHQVGDEVLCGIVDRLHGLIRDVDLLGRYGGDEFVLLLPETQIVGAMRVAERLLQSVSRDPFNTRTGAVSVSVSIGIAVLTPEVDSFAILLKQADEALYRAKTSGRNRVCTWEKPLSEDTDYTPSSGKQYA